MVAAVPFTPSAIPSSAIPPSPTCRAHLIQPAFARGSLSCLPSSSHLPFPPLTPHKIAAKQLDVVLEDEGELEAAELLLQCIYSTADPCRPLRAAPAAAALRVLRLAGRLEVAAGVRAAAQVLLERCRGGALPWDAVVAAFELPLPRGGEHDAAAAAAAARPLRAAAEAALLAELGDLDLALLDARARERLLALPFEAIRALLSDGRARASSEAAVFYAADAWLAARGNGSGSTSAEERAGLAACVRAPRLPLTYLSAVVAASPWYTESVPPEALHEAVAFAAARARIEALATSAVETPAPRLPAWALPARPASAARRLRMDWAVPLTTLRRLHRQAVTEGDGGSAEAAAPTTWAYAGMRWALELQATYEEGGRSGGGVTFGLFVTPSPPPLHPASGGAAAALVSAKISLDARCARKKLRAGGVMQLLLGREGRGFSDFFEIGAQPAAWDEGAWRGAGLVGEDGCVHVTATVRDVWS